MDTNTKSITLEFVPVTVVTAETCHKCFFAKTADVQLAHDCDICAVDDLEDEVMKQFACRTFLRGGRTDGQNGYFRLKV